MLGTICQSSHRNIPQDLNVQHHCSEKPQVLHSNILFPPKDLNFDSTKANTSVNVIYDFANNPELQQTETRSHCMLYVNEYFDSYFFKLFSFRKRFLDCAMAQAVSRRPPNFEGVVLNPDQSVSGSWRTK